MALSAPPTTTPALRINLGILCIFQVLVHRRLSPFFPLQGVPDWWGWIKTSTSNAAWWILSLHDSWFECVTGLRKTLVPYSKRASAFPKGFGSSTRSSAADIHLFNSLPNMQNLWQPFVWITYTTCRFNLCFLLICDKPWNLIFFTMTNVWNLLALSVIYREPWIIEPLSLKAYILLF